MTSFRNETCRLGLNMWPIRNKSDIYTNESANRWKINHKVINCMWYTIEFVPLSSSTLDKTSTIIPSFQLNSSKNWLNFDPKRASIWHANYTFGLSPFVLRSWQQWVIWAWKPATEQRRCMFLLVYRKITISQRVLSCMKCGRRLLAKSSAQQLYFI